MQRPVEPGAASAHIDQFVPVLHERLQLAADEEGVSPAEVYRRLTAVGVTMGARHIYKCFNGQSRDPGYRIVAALAQVLHVDSGWFLNVTDGEKPDDLAAQLGRYRERWARREQANQCKQADQRAGGSDDLG